MNKVTVTPNDWSYCRVMRICRRGKTRKVYVASKSRLAMMKKFLPVIQTFAMVSDVHGVQHGFTPGRSPVTNALEHRGFKFTLSMDLKDCFDHVTKRSVDEVIGYTSNFLYESGIARQGFPTSPSLCNIALSQLDNDLFNRIRGRGVYTRYADDLCVSSGDISVIEDMKDYIRLVVKDYGHEIKDSKTRIQSSLSGRRIITGVAVDDQIHPTRKVRRRLRASIHQGNKNQINGLQEWCKLKRPNAIRKAIQFLQDQSVTTSDQAAMILASRAGAILRDQQDVDSTSLC